ncbi:MAG: hypothetical protein CMI13_15315 [Oleibacter sp.]|nr:hypothetical protein [Thalassolituus sp.]
MIIRVSVEWPAGTEDIAGGGLEPCCSEGIDQGKERAGNIQVCGRFAKVQGLGCQDLDRGCNACLFVWALRRGALRTCFCGSRFIFVGAASAAKKDIDSSAH